MSEMKRVRARFAFMVPNEDPLNARLNELVSLSRKEPKELSGVHPGQWAKILSGRQSGIRSTTLMVKIAPALGMSQEEMNALIAETRKRHSTTRNQKQIASEGEILPQDRAALVKKIKSQKLTLETLSQLARDQKLRNRLSDEDKLLLLGLTLRSFLTEVEFLKSDFKRIFKRELGSGTSVMDLNLGSCDRFIRDAFAEGRLKLDPLLSGIQALQRRFSSFDPQRVDAPRKFAGYLQGIQWWLDRDSNFRLAATELLFLLKRVEVFDWGKFKIGSTHVEDLVQRVIQARDDIKNKRSLIDLKQLMRKRH